MTIQNNQHGLIPNWFDWGCQNPVFFDFETTSACDLPARGGRLYAADPTTQILSLVLDIDRTYHVWIPRLDNASELPSEQFLAGYGVDLRHLRIYVGETIPEPIIEAARSGRTFVGHNVMGFDRFIWERFLKDFPVKAWIDTLYLARSAGLPGGLDKLASVTLNSGKDSAKRLVEPLMFAKIQHGELVYPKLTRGLIGPLLRYNMVDVILLRQLWEGVFADLVVESDVLWAHQTINDTGVHIDKDLINWVQEISVVASANAAKKVDKLTNGAISEKNIRSVKQVREWLASKGLRIVTVDKFGMEKHTLRKDIVEQCINNPRLMLDPDSPVAIDVDNLDPTVFEVLRLRSASVRITSAKAERASKRIGDDGRIYDLHAYHQAHCVSGDTELLTKTGWVRIEDWNGGEIAQWDISGEIQFKLATANRFNNTEGMLVVDGPYLSGKFTLGHTIPSFSQSGKFVARHAGDMPNYYRMSVPISGVLSSSGKITPEQMRVFAMIQADGHWQTDSAQGRSLQVFVKKKRKKDRCRKLLTEAGIPFYEKEYPSYPGYTRFIVRWKDIPNWLTPETKYFGPWLLDSTPEARLALLDEVPFWDGSKGKDKIINDRYYSAIRNNREWVATIAHLSNRAACLYADDMTVGIRPTNKTDSRKEHWTQTESDSVVYCPTTETGYWVYRHNGKIGITGNTGRFGSLGLQIHNLPKPKAGLSKKALGFDGIEFLLSRFESTYKGNHDNQETYEDLDRICEEWTAKIREKNPFAPPLTVDDFMSALIRPSMVPDRWLDADGDVFGIADYAAIEARGLAWIADQPELLAAFERNEDVYTWFGNESNLFGRKISKADKDLRDICKVAVLGLGYGMGEKKFAIFLSMMGIDLSKYDLTVWGVIDRYRGLFPQIAGQFAGAINGRPYRKGGIWTALEAAAMNAVAGQGPQTAGKCRFVFVNGTLICELPSGRRLHYRNARIEDRIPAYVYALGLELKEKATLVYDNPHGYESSLYGGKICENCLAADTKVLTYRGILPIVEVQPGDLVWDGEQWVPTAGVVNNGEQETGTWQGVRLTRDHLIFDGRKWNSAISVTESVSRDALKWASDSVRSLFKSQESETTLIPKSDVIADRSAISITVDWYVNRILNVASVDTETPGRNGNGSLISFQTMSCGPFGYIDTQEFLVDVRTRIPQRIPLTVNAVSECVTSGETTFLRSSDMWLHYPIGISFRAISTELTMIGDMNPATFALYPGLSIPEIAGQPYLWNLTGSVSQLLSSANNIYPNGDERFTNITANAVDPLNGCWITTGKREPVYDLLNCGPNHRFTIITNHGPVVVHNCVQAICRDIMACSLVRLLKHDFRIVLHVHDEIVSQFKRVSTVDSLREMVRLMTVVPTWAKGFPVAVEGYCANRYLKTPQSGYPEFAALNGVVL